MSRAANAFLATKKRRGAEPASHFTNNVRSVSSTFDKLVWAIRCAFFRDCRDIARWKGAKRRDLAQEEIERL
jgi:hypothetical protein